MIYLYDSTETDFRYNGKPLPAAYDVTVSNTLNSEYYVMGKYPLDKDRVYKEIVEDRIIKVHTMDGMQPFRIVNISKQELYIEFEAWPLFYADMRNKLVKPLNLKRVSGQTALNTFKNNLLIDTPFDFYSDITDNHDYHTQDENERENNPKQLYNALDVFKAIVRRWGGELWIRGYDVRVNKRIGTDTEAMLYEKKNITEFVDTTNIEGIVTRLHGKSEWQDERQEGEEEGQKHSIEVTVDSPLINNYSGVVFEKQFTNNDIRTEQELKNWLNLKFTTENIDKPKRTIEVGTNVIDGTKIGFADTLILKYIKHDTDVRIKVVGYEYDGFANELKHVVLGQPKNTSSSTIGNTITDLVNNVVEPVDRKTTIAMSSADGKSTVFHGTADPNTLNLNAKENDTYFRTNGSEKEIWRFTGTLWELIIDTSDTTKNADAIEEQKKDIDEAKRVADEALSEIDQAIVNAGFSSLTDLTASLDGRTTALTTNVDSITGIVTDHTGRISTVEQTAAGLQATVASKASQSQVTQLDTLVNTKVSNDEFESQIGQLAGNINLRVEKGDVLSQINIEAERTLIESDKILLDADNVIFSGTAWIPSAVIGDIEADKITSGRLDAGQITVVNLDVNSLSGNTSNFVQTAWNSAAGGSVSISGSGITSTASTSAQTYIQNGVVGFRTPLGHGLGYIGVSQSGDRTNWDYDISNGSNLRFRYRESTGFKTVFEYVSYNDQLQAGVNLAMGDRDITNVNDVYAHYFRFRRGGYIRSNSENSAVDIKSLTSISLQTGSGQAIRLDDTHGYMYRTLSMEGNNITNQSDIRLKSNVEDSQLDALREIERLRFIDFEWDKSKGAINENKPEERQFGLIAQHTPFLQTKVGESESYLSVDLTKQINLNSKATQELLHYTRLLEKRIEVLENERTA